MNSDSTAVSRARSRSRFWLVTAAALLTLAATFSAGRWQLSRAAQKEALQAEIEAQKNLPPIGAQAFLALDDATAALHRPVHLRGLWLPSLTVYLDNRQMHGLQGFYVLTPFALEGSNETVLVQRGWIQRNFNDRTALQPVDTPAGLVEITGIVSPPPGHLLELGKAEAQAPAPAPAASAADAPAAPAVPAVPAASAANPSQASVGSSRIRQNLDLQAFRAESGLPLRTEVTLLQSGPSSDGLQRDWPAPALGVEKHYGYAFQWFGLSALVIFLYVWFQLIAPFRRARLARRT